MLCSKGDTEIMQRFRTCPLFVAPVSRDGLSVRLLSNDLGSLHIIFLLSNEILMQFRGAMFSKVGNLFFGNQKFVRDLSDRIPDVLFIYIYTLGFAID